MGPKLWAYAQQRVPGNVRQVHCGAPSEDRQMLQAWADEEDRKYPELKHWVEVYDDVLHGGVPACKALNSCRSY